MHGTSFDVYKNTYYICLYKDKRYVVNRELHIHYFFLFPFIALVYFVQANIPFDLHSRGIYIYIYI